MPTPVKKILVKVLLILLALLKGLGRLLLAIFRILAVPFVFLWKFVVRKLVFFVYRLLLRAKISSGRMVPALRGTFFAVFGHRYVVHGMMAIIVLFVSTKSLYARGVDPGQESTQALLNGILNIETDYEFQSEEDVESESQLNLAMGPVATGTSASLEDGGTDGPLTYDQSGVASPYVFPGGTAEEKVLISKPETYVVQTGDTISGIAQKYGVSVNTLLWANGLSARSLIRIGQELTILPVTGVLHQVKKGETLGAIAKKYGSDVEKILMANRVASASQIQIGEKLIIPDGRPPAAPAAPRPVATPSRLGDVRDIFAPPSEAPPSRAFEGVELVWPTVQKRINQYYKWRHQALDINGTTKDPVYAVDAGIVTSSGWNKSGYGNMILIDHGNGMITRYAHHSKLYVKAGDQVAKGQSIGLVGSTGRSTGPHLHFEIYVSGARKNPLEYYR